MTSQQQAAQSTQNQQQKFKCNKCPQQFFNYDLFKEHQLMHLMDPKSFQTSLTPSTSAALQLQSAQQLPFSSNEGGDLSTPFGLSGVRGGDESTKNTMKMFEESPTLDLSQSNTKNFDEPPNPFNLDKKEQMEFLYQYFLKSEPSEEYRQQLQMVMSKSPHNLYDFLFNFYQMNEYKKNNLQKNYDFLLKYYQMCEKDQTQIMASDKINLDFLLQYYQMNESKKTFQQQSELSLPKNVGGASSNVNSNTTITSISGINGGESMNDGLAAGCIVSGSMSSASSQSSLNSTPIGLSGGSALELMDSRDHHIGSYVGPSSTSSHSNVMSAVDKQANKRLRTTILPEQLNFLYECYQTESNPSRKMLEEISKKVNLKKRVVQVNSNE
jgi:hypothetical protein